MGSILCTKRYSVLLWFALGAGRAERQFGSAPLQMFGHRSRR